MDNATIIIGSNGLNMIFMCSWFEMFVLRFQASWHHKGKNNLRYVWISIIQYLLVALYYCDLYQNILCVEGISKIWFLVILTICWWFFIQSQT